MYLVLTSVGIIPNFWDRNPKEQLVSVLIIVLLITGLAYAAQKRKNRNTDRAKKRESGETVE